MKIIIDGSEMTDFVSVDDKWERARKSKRPTKPYALEVSRGEVCRVFADYYADYLADAKAHPPYEEDVVESQVLKLNCATLEGFWARDAQLLERFVEEVDYDLVQALMMAKAVSHNPSFFIQSVVQVSLGANALTLTGAAFDLRRDLLDKIAAKMPPGEPIPPEELPAFMSNYDIEDEDD